LANIQNIRSENKTNMRELWFPRIIAMEYY
jgi:hypothetical protein